MFVKVFNSFDFFLTKKKKKRFNFVSFWRKKEKRHENLYNFVKKKRTTIRTLWTADSNWNWKYIILCECEGREMIEWDGKYKRTKKQAKYFQIYCTFCWVNEIATQLTHNRWMFLSSRHSYNSWCNVCACVFVNETK